MSLTWNEKNEKEENQFWLVKRQCNVNESSTKRKSEKQKMSKKNHLLFIRVIQIIWASFFLFATWNRNNRNVRNDTDVASFSSHCRIPTDRAKIETTIAKCETEKGDAMSSWEKVGKEINRESNFSNQINKSVSLVFKWQTSALYLRAHTTIFSFKTSSSKSHAKWA